jgi:hypothetical protein
MKMKMKGTLENMARAMKILIWKLQC